MRRGTTSTNIFNTNEDLTDTKVYVSYFQRGRIVLEKTNKDIVIDHNKITVPLSQSDTLRLSSDVPIHIQVRYINNNGLASASNIIETKIEKILRGGVISYE